MGFASTGGADGSQAGYRDYLTMVAFGQIPGHVRVAFFGRALAVPAATPTDVWNGNVALYPWLAAATALEVVSSSAQDGPAGTGIASISIDGLTAAFVQVTQTVALNGLTPVVIPTPLFRINGIRTSAKGAGAPAFGAFNVGNITVRDAGAGTSRGFISAGIGIAQQSNFTVPAGKTLAIVDQAWMVDAPSSAKDFKVSTYIQNALTGVARLPLSVSVDGTPYAQPGSPPLALPEKTDFCYRIVAVSAGGNSYSANWLGVMKDNTSF